MARSKVECLNVLYVDILQLYGCWTHGPLMVVVVRLTADEFCGTLVSKGSRLELQEWQRKVQLTVWSVWSDLNWSEMKE